MQYVTLFYVKVEISITLSNMLKILGSPKMIVAPGMGCQTKWLPAFKLAGGNGE